MNTNFISITFVTLITFSSSSNILFVHFICTSSHRTAIWPLAEELANLGHNLTYIYPIPGTRVGSHSQIEELTPSKLVSLLTENSLNLDLNKRLNGSFLTWSLNVLNILPQVCEAFYGSPEIEEWLQRPNLSYDLIFIDPTLNKCGFGLVHKFQAKHILFSTLMTTDLYKLIGSVPESSSVPDTFIYWKPSEMRFVSRVIATALSDLFQYTDSWLSANSHSVVKRKLNLTNFPEVEDFEKNTSLLFVNSHFVEDYPLSLPPMVQSYSGLWCSEKYLGKGRNKLTDKLERFIQSGQDGFIYVSLGTYVKASTMPESMRIGFFKTFEAFPKMRFLVKWDEPGPSGIPKNVLLQNWFPQRDILAHPKIGGFINQAGRPSTQEALCYAVPVINIPVFADQDYNANRLDHIAATIVIGIDNFSGTQLKIAIKEIMENPRYKMKVAQISKMFRDRNVDHLKNAVYWTEYVLKNHDDSFLHKPLGVNQTWWERRLVDVYAALFIILLLFFLGLFLLLVCLLRLFGCLHKVVMAK